MKLKWENGEWEAPDGSRIKYVYSNLPLNCTDYFEDSESIEIARWPKNCTVVYRNYFVANAGGLHADNAGNVMQINNVFLKFPNWLLDKHFEDTIKAIQWFFYRFVSEQEMRLSDSDYYLNRCIRCDGRGIIHNDFCEHCTGTGRSNWSRLKLDDSVNYVINEIYKSYGA